MLGTGFATTRPPQPASTCPRNGGAASLKPASSSRCGANVWLINSSRWLRTLAAKILGDVCRDRPDLWGPAPVVSLLLPQLSPHPRTRTRTRTRTCTCSPTHLTVELGDQVHAVGEEEVGQIPLVQAQLFVHWEVCPPLIKLDNIRWVSRSHGADPDPCLGPDLSMDPPF